MGCTNSDTNEKNDVMKMAPQEFIEPEVEILSKIFDDLAERNDKNKTITKENFLLFFHKTGYWGDRLYDEFAGKNNEITKKRFFDGIAHIFQTTEEMKIELLYNYYVETKQNRGQGKRGLTFQEFLSIIYSYPKQDLQQILDDPDFLSENVRQYLKKCRENKSSENIDESRLIPKKMNGSFHDSKSDADYEMAESEPSVGRLESGFGYKTQSEFINNQRKSYQMDMHMDGKKVRIKLHSYNTIIRKFARSVFQSHSIDIQKGRLKKQQFIEWIKKHKNLYNNYYNGFHGEIWEYSRDMEPKPRFLSVEPDFQSKAQFLYKNCANPCHLKLINSTIMILNQDCHSEVYGVINLEGLSVDKGYDAKKGWKIIIKHRDQKYIPKHFIFKDEETCDKWMHELRFYKGIDIRNLYQFGKKIGMGNFSVVYEVIQKKTGKKWAMKQIKNQKLKQSQIETIQHQIEVMKKFDNPLLIQHKDTIQTKQNTYIITQLVKQGKQLSEYVRLNKGPLEEIEAAIIARQIILGVLHIHKVGYIHRDLKPENIMIVNDLENKELSLKIIDFGLSLNTQTALRGVESTFGGTPGYISPEQFRTNYLSEAADSFSIGGIIYFMLTGATPFFNSESDTRQIILNRNKNMDLKFDDSIWSQYSPSARELVEKMMSFYPDSRLQLKDALVHQWFKDTYQHQNNIKSQENRKSK